MANTITGSFGLDLSPLRAAANKAVGITDKMAHSIGSRLKSFVTSPLAQVGAAIGAYFTYENFKSGIQGVIEAGSEMEKMRARTGASIGSLATLKALAMDTDSDFFSLANALNKMQRNLFGAAKGGGPLRSVLQLLHLDIDQIAKMKPEEQFKTIGDAISNLPSPMARSAAAIQIFGRAGAELLPLFEQIGSADFGNLSEKAKLLEKDAASFHQITIAFRKANANTKNLFVGMADALIPILGAISHYLASKNALAFGQTLGKGIAAAVDVLVGAFSDPSKLLGGFFNYALAFTSDWMNKLAGWLMKAAVIFVNGISIAWDALKNVGGLLGGAALSFVGTILDGMGKVGSYLYAGLQFAFQKAAELLMKAMHPLFALLEKLGSTKIGAKIGLGGFKVDNFGFKADTFENLLKNAKSSSAFSKWGGAMKEQGGDMMSTALDGLSGIGDAIAKFKDGAANVFKSEINQDFFGAAEYRKKAQSALETLRAAGEKTLAAFAPKTAQKTKDPWARFANFETFAPNMLTTGSLKAGGIQTSWNNLNMAYGHSNILSAAERRGFTDAGVARGAPREGSMRAAFHAIRSGDHARRKAYEKEQARQKLGIDATNKHLEDIYSLLYDNLEE